MGTYINIFLITSNTSLISRIQFDLLKYGVQVDEISRNFDTALEEYKKKDSGIVLMDINKYKYKKGNQTTPEELLQQLRQHDPAIKVILFTNEFAEDILPKWKPRGAWGYVFRTTNEIQVLAKCIYVVYRGGACFLKPKTAI